MSTAGEDAPATGSASHPSDDFTKTWRYKIGIALIIFGHLCLAVGLLLPLLGLVPKGGAGIVGALLGGGEVISMISIAFLGLQGFKAIKSKIFGVVTAGFDGPIGRVRHAVGITLFVSSFLTNYVILFYAWTAFRTVTVEEPFPLIWDLDYGQQATLVHWLAIWGEVSFLASIYVLGGVWWGRFRALFTRDAAQG